ncbi:head-to-tail stopper [Gordonia phage OtterstedtS21]|uniref:Head-to-tail stopper n=4 Tax=Lambovirus TaxID=2843412 RepID=A0A9E7QQL2_9CAUD|nr:head-to-tail stopper [Gordonia phage Gibbin]YP_009852670.1 head-to-tail stopper [Gordonia phage Sadboi]QFG08159.1 head-to-tail stopper [Gordonia phage GretelLyn]UVT31183.1 head-to-tail stopper [Gordonia phage OtterstedtS21]QFG10562.1 head-to-tail stopper [Gordonia phage Gibbin]QFG14670.1 head-to-tail stopper [Gordonia phage Sadboi]
MTDLNLDLLRQQTVDFINTDPTPITLKTTTMSRLPGGGYKKLGDIDREPQVFKLIWQGGSGSVTSDDGVDSQYDMILLGAHDAEMEIGDYWTLDGVKYVIQEFLPGSGYQRKAKVKAFGAKPIGG